MSDSREDWKRTLEKAKEAAVQKDVRTFLQLIHDSRFLDGAKRTLEAKYEGALDRERIHEIISVAVDKFYEVASEGKKILFPAAYLWKILRAVAYDTCQNAKKYVSIEGIGKGDVISECLCESYGESSKGERDKRKKDGIRIARSLLPKMGSENVQKVMGYIIDAVEAGVEDISSHEIADALGLSEGSIRKWKQRGFERLERAAIEEGYRKEFLRDIALEDIDEDQDA